MNFWESKTGNTITGKLEDARLPDFTVIPDGTMALAKIDVFVLVEKTNTYTGAEESYYEVTWKVTSDDFKGRIVSQKLKVFEGKPESIDRNLNMMKLIMDLCLFKPKHSNAPSDDDLRPMIGKVLGVKIREWSMPKKDGSGVMEGNFVSEVWPIDKFKCEIGKKLEVVHTMPLGIESALTRNANKKIELDDDIPF